MYRFSHRRWWRWWRYIVPHKCINIRWIHSISNEKCNCSSLNGQAIIQSIMNGFSCREQIERNRNRGRKSMYYKTHNNYWIYFRHKAMSVACFIDFVWTQQQNANTHFLYLFWMWWYGRQHISWTVNPQSVVKFSLWNINQLWNEKTLSRQQNTSSQKESTRLHNAIFKSIASLPPPPPPPTTTSTKKTRTNNEKRKAEIEIQVKFLWVVRRFMHYIFLIIYINIESVIHGTQVAQTRGIRQAQQQQQQQQRVNGEMEIENENAENIVLSHSSSTRMSSYIFTYYCISKQLIKITRCMQGTLSRFRCVCVLWVVTASYM